MSLFDLSKSKELSTAFYLVHPYKYEDVFIFIFLFSDVWRIFFYLHWRKKKATQTQKQLDHRDMKRERKANDVEMKKSHTTNGKGLNKKQH